MQECVRVGAITEDDLFGCWILRGLVGIVSDDLKQSLNLLLVVSMRRLLSYWHQNVEDAIGKHVTTNNHNR